MEDFVEKREKDIQALEFQIQSHCFHCQNQPFELKFLLKQEVVVLAFDIDIEESFENGFDDSHMKLYDGNKRIYDMSKHDDQFA